MQYIIMYAFLQILRRNGRKRIRTDTKGWPCNLSCRPCVADGPDATSRRDNVIALHSDVTSAASSAPANGHVTDGRHDSRRVGGVRRIAQVNEVDTAAVPSTTGDIRLTTINLQDSINDSTVTTRPAAAAATVVASQDYEVIIGLRNKSSGSRELGAAAPVAAGDYTYVDDVSDNYAENYAVVRGGGATDDVIGDYANNESDVTVDETEANSDKFDVISYDAYNADPHIRTDNETESDRFVQGRSVCSYYSHRMACPLEPLKRSDRSDQSKRTGHRSPHFAIKYIYVPIFIIYNRDYN